eukprot:CAMPEP_0202966864 /NCGR_PEP_ID=MMETSP1396-20130829/11481_1 /ASSEMBLY_ACC=CAM_ASM_000872 /TAXON_ID= /ORGANISM="Pseudokeronopsis sp., Strain Brazil" /LENGTH=85 /DNA_ID=CAMNT_0049691227 /DNA_START=140 /DNA_END=397 /DNA_ORIENTATION=-
MKNITGRKETPSNVSTSGPTRSAKRTPTSSIVPQDKKQMQVTQAKVEPATKEKKKKGRPAKVAKELSSDAEGKGGEGVRAREEVS